MKVNVILIEPKIPLATWFSISSWDMPAIEGEAKRGYQDLIPALQAITSGVRYKGSCEGGINTKKAITHL